MLLRRFRASLPVTSPLSREASSGRVITSLPAAAEVQRRRLDQAMFEEGRGLAEVMDISYPLPHRPHPP